MYNNRPIYELSNAKLFPNTFLTSHYSLELCEYTKKTALDLWPENRLSVGSLSHKQ